MALAGMKRGWKVGRHASKVSATDMKTQGIRILCVDDHRIVLEGLASVFNQESDLEVVATAADGTEAVRQYDQCQPDIVLMDLSLPKASGIEAIRNIRSKDRNARILVFTMYEGDEDIHKALEAGASGYVLKDTPTDALIRAVREIHSGGVVVASGAATRLAERSQGPTLTPREREVIQLVAEGLRNKEIAARLGIGRETVQSHLRSLFAKLNVHDRTTAMAVALRRGIIHLE